MKKFFILFLSVLFTSPLLASGIDMGATGVACDETTLETYGGTTDMEIEWEPNTINLNWWNGDEQVSGQSSCTYDGIINVPTQPTRPGYTFNGWKVTKVPGGFTELEYIESNDTQYKPYINTGIIQNYGTRVTFEFSFKPSRDNGWFGGDAYTQVLINSTNGFSVNHTSNIRVVYDGATESIYNNDVLKHTITWENNFNKLPILLFAVGMSSGENPANTGTRPYGKLYYAKIYNANDEIVRNFIPVKRKSDNVVGMYDSVSGQFFTNSGTGNFTAGPVVQ